MLDDAVILLDGHGRAQGSTRGVQPVEGMWLHVVALQGYAVASRSAVQMWCALLPIHCAVLRGAKACVTAWLQPWSMQVDTLRAVVLCFRNQHTRYC